METARAVRAIKDLVTGTSRVLILTHNNPDPDAIAAAFGLKALVEAFGPRAVIGYGGIIGRAENRAMVKQLRIKMFPIDMLDPQEHDVVAVVDAQPSGGNTPLGENGRIDIVIDHHPLREGMPDVKVLDVREEYGATSTIITGYLHMASVEWDENLATALFYGIKSDIGDLSRDSTRADHLAMRMLFPSLSHNLLTRIERPRIPAAHFLALREAIGNVQVYDDVLVSDLGTVDSPDMIAEMADDFLRLKGILWTMCLGECEGTLHFSLRALLHGSIAGPVAAKLLQGMGSGGGHDRSAAGAMPLPEDEEARREIKAQLIERFLQAIDRQNAEGRYL